MLTSWTSRRVRRSGQPDGLRGRPVNRSIEWIHIIPAADHLAWRASHRAQRADEAQEAQEQMLTGENGIFTIISSGIKGERDDAGPASGIRSSAPTPTTAIAWQYPGKTVWAWVHQTPKATLGFSAIGDKNPWQWHSLALFRLFGSQPPP